MVQNGAIDCPRRGHQQTRETLIDGARRRIAARMIVREQYASTAMADHICNDRPERERNAGFVALEARQANAVHFRIDMSNPKGFTGRVRFTEPLREEPVGRLHVGESGIKFWTLTRHLRLAIHLEQPSESNRFGFGLPIRHSVQVVRESSD